jgi:hypothetical protein
VKERLTENTVPLFLPNIVKDKDGEIVGAHAQRRCSYPEIEALDAPVSVHGKVAISIHGPAAFLRPLHRPHCSTNPAMQTVRRLGNIQATEHLAEAKPKQRFLTMAKRIQETVVRPEDLQIVIEEKREVTDGFEEEMNRRTV